MDKASLNKKIEMLSDESKEHLNTFIEYLIYKHNKDLTAGERKAGFLEGEISITSDFDEPLEEFKEYM
jgi:rubrerythrin